MTSENAKPDAKPDAEDLYWKRIESRVPTQAESRAGPGLGKHEWDIVAEKPHPSSSRKPVYGQKPEAISGESATGPVAFGVRAARTEDVFTSPEAYSRYLDFDAVPEGLCSDAVPEGLCSDAVPEGLCSDAVTEDELYAFSLARKAYSHLTVFSKSFKLDPEAYLVTYFTFDDKGYPHRDTIDKQTE